MDGRLKEWKDGKKCRQDEGKKDGRKKGRKEEGRRREERKAGMKVRKVGCKET
jgi:hypothetical protein